MAGAALGGADAVIESQRRLLEQSSRRPGGSTAPLPPASQQSGNGRSGADLTSAAVETQRRLLEEARRGAGNSTGSTNAKAAGAQHLPASSAAAMDSSNKVRDQQRRLLEEANRRANSQQQGNLPMATQQQRLQGASTGLGRSGSEYKALHEMGFKEPQIRVAEALMRGSINMMTDLLLRARFPARLEGDAKKLAEAIQEQVFGLDRAELAGEAVLDLVTLLCVDEELLRAAVCHFDAEVLAEFLMSVSCNRGPRWTRELNGAVTVVLELLSAAPRQNLGPPSAGRHRGMLSAPSRPRGDDYPASPCADADSGLCSL